MSDDFDITGRNLTPGEVPQGTRHKCLTDVGLLFTSRPDQRLLVGAVESSADLLVTADAAQIAEYLYSCFVYPL